MCPFDLLAYVHIAPTQLPILAPVPTLRLPTLPSNVRAAKMQTSGFAASLVFLHILRIRSCLKEDTYDTECRFMAHLRRPILPLSIPGQAYPCGFLLVPKQSAAGIQNPARAWVLKENTKSGFAGSVVFCNILEIRSCFEGNASCYGFSASGCRAQSLGFQ